MLSGETKKKILSEILGSEGFLGKYSDYEGILTFLSKIWNIKEMPSEDGRYKDAYGDIRQHVVNNNDWTYEELFTARLNIIEGEEKFFIDFLELIVSPLVRENREEIILYVSKINQQLKNTDAKLILTDYFEDLPIFKVRTGNGIEHLPINIAENKIPIYLSSNPDKKIYPHFVIYYNAWDDFGYVTTVALRYYIQEGKSISLGNLKIANRHVKETWKVLSGVFYTLDADYFSLGQSDGYYIELKKTIGQNFHSFLLAMRDVAMFPKINELYEMESVYRSSLIRYNSSERLVRTIRFQLEGIDPNEYFKFNYTNKPPYSNNDINFNFNFEYDREFEHRIYALIGENGTGKTRILSSLAQDLGNKEATNFSPRMPIYGKVFTVSYSFFDKFDIPKADASFNYVYCGLKKSDGSWKSEHELLEAFYDAANKISEKNLHYEWFEILQNFLPESILSQLKFKKVEVDNRKVRIFDINAFDKTKGQLSSGQSIILFILSEILSQIRYDSLIIYDEPETHLHPNAISSLMNTLFRLVDMFQSFCIIATHSPLIIQELPSRNVFIIDRDGNSSEVRQLSWESLGENLTVITQDIFGNSEIPKHFMEIIKSMLARGKEYDEIISLLESNGLPVTSNIRLYIKSLAVKN